MHACIYNNPAYVCVCVCALYAPARQSVDTTAMLSGSGSGEEAKMYYLNQYQVGVEKPRQRRRET